MILKVFLLWYKKRSPYDSRRFRSVVSEDRQVIVIHSWLSELFRVSRLCCPDILPLTVAALAS